jgi:hypothetical protein
MTRCKCCREPMRRPTRYGFCGRTPECRRMQRLLARRAYYARTKGERQVCIICDRPLNRSNPYPVCSRPGKCSSTWSMLWRNEPCRREVYLAKQRATSRRLYARRKALRAVRKAREEAGAPYCYAEARKEWQAYYGADQKGADPGPDISRGGSVSP